MKKSELKYHLLPAVFCFLLIACKSKEKNDTEEVQPEVRVPVTVIAPATGPMVEIIELNATSQFLQKSFIKASTSGYITTVNAKVGDPVTTGQRLFILKTREAKSIGNTINLLDSSFRFSGIIPLDAGSSGFVSEVNHQLGDYVQEGEQLAVINDRQSLSFLLNLPYELRPYVVNRKNVELELPDGTKLIGTISSALPEVDSASQTQAVIIRINEKNIPANLIAKVRVIKRMSSNTISLPKQAVLSDETQTQFWVMRAIDTSTAVKVPVKKGIESADRVEIVSPKLDSTDKILLTGNFGMADTARIKITGQ